MGQDAIGALLPGVAHPGAVPRAQMAELVDAPSSGGGARKGVEVRVLFWAPLFQQICIYRICLFELEKIQSTFLATLLASIEVADVALLSSSLSLVHLLQV